MKVGDKVKAHVDERDGDMGMFQGLTGEIVGITSDIPPEIAEWAIEDHMFIVRWDNPPSEDDATTFMYTDELEVLNETK